jgi:MarR family transcriptional regulator for hemolysin
VRGGRDGPGDHYRADLSPIATELSVTRRIALKLGVIARQMRKGFDSTVGEVGVTRSQWTVIAVVARHPGATQRTIAEALDMTEAAAGRLIDRLCSDGLLERRPKPDDRRAYSVHLTAAAGPILKKLGGIGERNEGIAFAGLSTQELAQLDKLLDRVFANLNPGRE